MVNHYPGNSYHTPADNARDFLDRLLLGTRWYFYFNIMRVVLDARRYSIEGRYDDDAWVESSYRMLRCHERCGAHCHFMGLDNISLTNEPAIFIGNHMSTAETFLMPSIIVPRKKVTFVVKKNLLDYPLFGSIMRTRDPVAVSRRDPKEDFKAVMSQGKEKLGFGTSLVIFPQSTRMQQFSPKNFNTIGIKLAKSTGVPIVPFALKTDFWGKGWLLKDFGPVNRSNQVYIEFGEPFRVAGNGKEEHQRIIDFIKSRLEEWEPQNLEPALGGRHTT
ncbi:MAG: 1-acyl-sn-glycerol-3-phosphate acyltransferase [Victivallales bacterium]|nr:1-acyl-sn-glycerol-3-phosphate acyltransferase [Victivallales bacterium]